MNEWMLLGWGLTVVLGLALGITSAQYLTVLPLRIGLYAFLTAISVCGLFFVILTFFSGWALAGATALGLASSLCGYAWMSRQILSHEDVRQIPELTRRKDDPGIGHTAVVYFTHGEPQTYNPIGWLNQFREFDQQKVPFIPKLLRPIFIYRLRGAYLKVGASHHRGMHQQMIRRLAESMRSNGRQDTRFYLSFLDDEPRPDAAVIQALNEGASRIVVAEVFVSISNHTAEGEHQVRAIKADEYVPLRFTGPLWDSLALQRMFVEKANAARGTTRGPMLV